MQEDFLNKMDKEKRKQMYIKNREKERQKQKEYYQKHREFLKKQSQNYYNINKDMISQKCKENYIWNRFEKVIKQRQYYQDNKEKILKQMSEFTKQNRDIMNERNNIYKQKYPEKFEARRQAKYRIKIPENQICVMCNEKKATDRHHEDYSKPLEVKFICHQCNVKMERCEIC